MVSNGVFKGHFSIVAINKCITNKWTYVLAQFGFSYYCSKTLTKINLGRKFQLTDYYSSPKEAKSGA